ncbi:MAG: hypothetical protein AB4368_10040 [Xenococcaceae cyanobacterium]
MYFLPEKEGFNLNSQPPEVSSTNISIDQEEETNTSLSSLTCLGDDKDEGSVVCTTQALVKRTTKF